MSIRVKSLIPFVKIGRIDKNKMCHVPNCTASTREQNKLCLSHFGRTPFAIRSKLSKAFQKNDQELINLLTVEAIKYFKGIKNESPV